jgi:hypothetical protein
VCTSRALGPALASGLLWSVAPNRYEIRQLDTTGRVFMTVKVEGSPWFEAWDQLPPPAEPHSSIVNVYEDPQRRLWIGASTPHSKWQAPTGGVGMVVQRLDNPALIATTEARLGTVVDVIDLASRRVLASARFENPMIRLTASDRAFSRRVDPDGFVLIDILQVAFVSPEGSRR